MGGTKRAKRVLLKFFRGELVNELPCKGLYKEQELTDLIPSKYPDIRKNHIKKALQKLLRKGDIVSIVRNRDVCYQMSSNEDDDLNNDESDGEDATGTQPEKVDKVEEHEESQQPVPFAELMRQKAEAALPQMKVAPTKKSVRFSEPSDDDEMDIDDQIRRLERELEEDISDDYSTDEDDDDEARNNPNATARQAAASRDTETKESTILSLSTLADDRIRALPATCLPQAGASKRLFSSVDARNKSDSSTTAPNKKIKKDDKKQQQVSKGLREAVEEVLNGYVARSSERLPFYCRLCAKQYENEREFTKHKKGAFHKAAVAIEQKATYCRLCHKQLTSPTQMEEHLKSRPHRERLQSTKRKQARGSTQDSRASNYGHDSRRSGGLNNDRHARSGPDNGRPPLNRHWGQRANGGRRPQNRRWGQRT